MLNKLHIIGVKSLIKGSVTEQTEKPALRQKGNFNNQMRGHYFNQFNKSSSFRAWAKRTIQLLALRGRNRRGVPPRVSPHYLECHDRYKIETIKALKLDAVCMGWIINDNKLKVPGIKTLSYFNLLKYTANLFY